jgi:ATP-dependent exoDNAse (exonuclease V) beta subunit
MRRDLATKSYQAIYEDIKAWREPLRKGPFAELNILRYDAQEKPGADELRLCEARAVAKTILQLTSSGERLVYDEKEKKWTTPRFRHIAIICRQLKGLAYAYERAFQEAGIPYHVTAGSDFYSRQEVLDVLNMLRVLDNSGDDYALAGALRSPMFAMSDEALYWISALEGDSFSAKFRSGAEHAKMAKEEKEKLARAREVGALLRSLKDRVSLPELINRILEMTGLEAVLATTFNGTRKIANLRKLVEVARSFEASRIFSLRDFITYVNEFLTEEMRESQAPIEEEEQDVVRILTIHKAKGLEFPLVIVPDICPKTEKKPGRGNIGLSGDLGLVVKLRQHPGKDEPPNGIFELFEHEEDSKELAESKRLLYVAATRAKDALIFSACLENGGQPKRWLGDISKSLGLNLSPDKGKSGERIAIHNLDCREFERPLTFSRRSEKKIQSIIRIVETAGSAKRPQASAAAPLTGPIATSLAAKRSFNPTELVEYEFCPRKYYHHFVCGHPQILAAPRKESIVPALTIGDISHRLFEMLHPGDRDKQIADAISAEGQFTDAQKEKLAETMRDFLEKFDSAPLAAELAGARESWEEVSFAAKCGDAAIEGKMDKVFRDARGALHIVDYKSDLVPDGKFQEKLDRYRLQLAAYGIGLKAATGETPASVRLYFFRYGETATLPMSEKKLDGLRSEIMRVIADIRANRFDRTAAAPCACGFEWLCGKESKQERIAK